MVGSGYVTGFAGASNVGHEKCGKGAPGFHPEQLEERNCYRQTRVLNQEGFGRRKASVSFRRTGSEMPADQLSGSVEQVVCCTIWNTGETQDRSTHQGLSI